MNETEQDIETVMWAGTTGRDMKMVPRRVPPGRLLHDLALAVGATARWHPKDGVAVVIRVIDGNPRGARL